jgi:ubiquitin C-terminal hydrolase
MNATLQCLINIDPLTRYLLNFNNFNYIVDNISECKLLSCYCSLLEKVICDEKIENSYSPKDFKEIISLKNPLFQGVQANDSKDLIYFLIEQMCFELNIIN